MAAAHFTLVHCFHQRKVKIETEVVETTYQNHSVTIWPISAYIGKRVKTYSFSLAIDGKRLPLFCPDLRYRSRTRSRVDRPVTFQEAHVIPRNKGVRSPGCSAFLPADDQLPGCVKSFAGRYKRRLPHSQDRYRSARRHCGKSGDALSGYPGK